MKCYLIDMGRKKENRPDYFAIPRSAMAALVEP